MILFKKKLTLLDVVVGGDSMRFCEFQQLNVWQQFQNKLPMKISTIMD